MAKTDLNILESYGFKRVGSLSLKGGRFVIEAEDKSAIKLEKTIYAFVIGGKIMRFGSSKGKLKDRFRSWERDVIKRLQGRKSSTPDWEAKEWRKRLKKHGGGIVFARQGSKVTTPIGTFPAYLDEESVLIGRHLPPLNRSKYR